MFRLIPKPIQETVPLAIEPVPYELRVCNKRLADFDTETDPFDNGVIVKPFTCGFGTKDPHPEDEDKFASEVDGYFYQDFWGDDCIDQFFAWLATLEGQYCIYVHNGGNFDFYFCLEYMDAGSAPFIINGRLARISMQGQEFRDSYSLIPVALAQYEKTIIDYSKFKRDADYYDIQTREKCSPRDLHREEILSYQRDDCYFLLELVISAHELFGDKLTMASVALPKLRSFHGFETMRERTDAELRPYYFGGRNQCFEIGELHGDWKIYDVNSMYPHVMATALHPVSARPHYETRITDRTDFATIRAWSNGALPIRKGDGGLSFPIGYGTYYASIHEINAGLETGTLRISKVLSSVYFEAKTSFADFVNNFYERRLEAKRQGDKIRLLYYKLVLNSSYGKLAQDPRRYENFLFAPDHIPTPLRCVDCSTETPRNEYCEHCAKGTTSPFGWYVHTMRDGAIIYARPSAHLSRHGFYNVATAASITGAARAYLLRGISRATRPIYCDTDSIICEALDAELDDSKLGAWKLEATGNKACIAGKKMYAVFDDGKPIKSASKGVKLTPSEIARVCAGDTIEYSHPVPKFSLDGSVSFTTRNIKRTGELV